MSESAEKTPNRWRVYRDRMVLMGVMYRIGTDVSDDGRSLGRAVYPSVAAETVEELRSELQAMLAALDDPVVDLLRSEAESQD